MTSQGNTAVQVPRL
nr:unnamed protein product [Callosobruchus analis]